MQTSDSNSGGRSSSRATRVGMLIVTPLVLLAGIRAVSGAAATVKVWNNGDTLTATDLNANFAALTAGQAPAQIVANFNAAVSGGATVTLGPITPAAPQFDLRWALQHAAASGACAAASPVSDSGWGHIVLVRPTGVTCTAACAASTAGNYTHCRTQIAIGGILMTQAKAPSDVVATNYQYACDATNAADELMGQAADGTYTGYCCCYH